MIALTKRAITIPKLMERMMGYIRITNREIPRHIEICIRYFVDFHSFFDHSFIFQGIFRVSCLSFFIHHQYVIVLFQMTLVKKRNEPLLGLFFITSNPKLTLAWPTRNDFHNQFVIRLLLCSTGSRYLTPFPFFFAYSISLLVLSPM